MCGIAGFIDSNYSRDSGLELLENMLASIAHRGPDARGKWNEEHVFLGQNRLSIIDLSEASNQPFLYEDLVISFNGEIYNYIEIKEELIKKGHHFTTQGDTEVICAAYKEYGERCVEQFMGMWAFALWDKTKKKLFCSRDRFGIKPFYYIEKNGGFYFGSEYKPVKFSPLFSNNLNIEQVSRGLQLGWVCYEDETFFTDIKLLPAASNLVFENGSSKILEYWNIATAKPSIPNSFEERVDTFKSLLYNSTRLHMRSDVEVAVALSGGIDSSALTAIMCSLFPNQNVSSFSIYFDGKNDVDEREYMYEVVNKYKNIQPAYIKPDANYIEENLLNILSTSEVPATSSSFASHYALMQEVKNKNIKVILDGQGADEFLLGYTHMLFRLGGNYLSKAKLIEYSHLIGSLNEMGITGKTKTNFVLRTILSSLSNEAGIVKKEFLHAIPNGLKVDLSKTNFSDRYNNLDKSHQSIAYQLFYSSLPTILHYVDRMTMAHSVESRVPLLDHRIVEFAYELNDSDYFKNGLTKYILRESVKDLLPPKIYNRKDKKGFVAPGETKWLRGAFKHLLEIDYKQYSFIDEAKVKPIIERYKNGDNANIKLVWRIAMLNQWLKYNRI